MTAGSEMKDRLRADIALLKEVAEMQIAGTHSLPQRPAMRHDPHAPGLHATQHRLLGPTRALVEAPRPSNDSRPPRPARSHDGRALRRCVIHWVASGPDQGAAVHRRCRSFRTQG